MTETTTSVDLAQLPQVELAVAPTPLQETPRLAAAIGLRRLYVKRDDNTGLALGGNKARKLEFLVGDALAQGADTLITMGGAQSNHCRMTAAAAAANGLAAHLVFNGQPIEVVEGNMVLDELLGAQWSFAAAGQTSVERMQEVAAELESQGHRPYVIPSGGTNGLGILGYVKAAFELAEQLELLRVVPQYVVCASGSCGTQAGLTLGLALAGVQTQVVGVSISPMIQDKEERVRQLIGEAVAVLGIAEPEYAPLNWYAYLGEGYGRPTEASREALRVVARSEGIVLDPVYTAKAFSGLIGEVAAGRVGEDETVVFMHTGGSPALFAETETYWPKPA